ncbi:MAG: hypothetical protein MUP82_04140 [Candidatus Marinimicrobia bacterium]|nr:hypothetical protein [Candidatus Neomarinimicrobiota bacterium]
MSVGYTSPINGSNVAFSIFAKRPGNAGGAIQGWMPQSTQLTDKRYNEFENIRQTLKNAWNTTYPSQLRRNNIKQSITTPFRAVNNAGDLLSRENYSCGGSCQSFQSRPGLKGLKTRFGSVSVSCTPSAAYSTLQLNRDIPASACNVKYVYDSSDYVTYLKQRAINKNYNDYSYGGDQSSASQSAQRAIRRY